MIIMKSAECVLILHETAGLHGTQFGNHRVLASLHPFSITLPKLLCFFHTSTLS